MRGDSGDRPCVGADSLRSDAGTRSRYRIPLASADADRGVLRDLRTRKSVGERHLCVGLTHM